MNPYLADIFIKDKRFPESILKMYDICFSEGLATEEMKDTAKDMLNIFPELKGEFAHLKL